MVTLPDNATSAALLEPLPTSIFELSRFSSLVNSIAAPAATEALTTASDASSSAPTASSARCSLSILAAT